MKFIADVVDIDPFHPSPINEFELEAGTQKEAEEKARTEAEENGDLENPFYGCIIVSPK